MNRVPSGSLWRVRSSYLLHTKDTEIEMYVRELMGSTLPEPPTLNHAENRFVRISVGTVLLVGETVNRSTGTDLQRQQQFVHVLMPQTCYLNRSYFNAGMDTLERIS